MHQFELFKVSQIRYTKVDQIEDLQYPTQDFRKIIPTFIPDQNMKAVDVTSLSEVEREIVAGLLQEYANYVKDTTKRIFSFDIWLDHTSNTDKIEGKIEWRTFNLSRIE